MNAPNTEKLYLDNPYETDFCAKVLSVSPGNKKGTAVVLDRSLFYPESGGQTADRGKLGDFDVVDVREGEGESVVHIIRGEGAPGDKVEGHIDWAWRFDHMQQHTGQHVLSRAFIETAGLQTVSFHMGEDTSTIDLEGAGFDESVCRRSEELASSIIEENRPVTTKTVPIGEVNESELRRKVPDGVTNVRLVEITGFDRIPCCGTHVAGTGELRVIKVLRHEKAKGNERVYFKVGQRAIDDYRAKHDIVQALANRLTTSGADITAKVDKLIEESQAGRKAIRGLAHKLAVVEKDLLLAAAQPIGEHRLVARVIPDADVSYLRELSNVIKGEGGVIVLLGADDGSVICAASDGITIDLAGPIVDLARAMGGSGGGRGSFAQVMLPRGADLEAFLTNVEEDVRHRL